MKRFTAAFLCLLLLLGMVSVAFADTKVTAIKLNKTEVTLDKGKTFQLKAKITPANATNKKVKWTTSNKKVATVSSTGMVKGVKEGTATITCTAADGSGVTATCTVNVREKLDYEKYYTQKLKPAMDSIAKCMTEQHSSLDDIKNAFAKAKEEYEKLEIANNNLDILKKDSKVKKYLKAMKKNIEEGCKRAETAPENDSKIETYQQNAAKNLKLYTERVKELLNIS